MNSPQHKYIPIMPLITVMTTLTILAPHSPRLQAMPGAKDKDIRPIMNGMFHTMTELLPLSLDDSAFFLEKNEPIIKSKLDTLESFLTKLQSVSHAYPETGFRQRRDHFIDDIKLAKKSFNFGTKRHAQFRINESLEYCMGCHSLNASDQDSGVPLKALTQLDRSRFGDLTMAKFLTMSRHFTEALDEYERILSRVGLSLEEKIFNNPYRDYLILAVRVKDEAKRAEAFLLSQKSKEESAIIRVNIEKWIRALKDIQGLTPPSEQAAVTATIVKLMKRGAELSLYPADRGGLVYYAKASRLLRSQIEVQSKPSASASDLAQSYLWLGQCELIIDDDSYQALDYFADAIQSDPGSAVAKQAFALYEENMVLGFTGSAGTFIPEYEKTKLNHLRRLSQSKTTSQKG